MKAKHLIIGIFAACLVSLVTTEARAQFGEDIERTTAGSTQLLIPLTARTVGLGAGMTAGVTAMGGLEGLDANPANLTINSGTNVLFSRMEYVADIGLNYFGVAQRFGANQVGLTISTWDFGEIPLQTETNPEISDVTYTADYSTVGATFARDFTDRIAAGFTVKIVSETIDDVGTNGLAFDAGMTYVVGESGLRFGVSLKNFGPSKQYSGTGLVRFVQLPDQSGAAQASAVAIEGAEFELPSLLNFGLTYTRELGASANVTLLGNFRSNSFSQDQFSGGVELGLLDVLYVRGGYQFEQDMDKSFYNGANFGAGLNLDLSGTRFTVDYAYRSTDFFDGVNLITASLTL